ncbi:MAG: ABC transporter permease [Candidatus Izemoplasmatales bacterium]
MVRYIIKRILWMIAILLIILTIVYFVTSLVQMNNFIRPKIPFPENFKIVANDYSEYFKKIIFEWDWGVSELSDSPEKGIPVWDLLKQRAPVTLRINIATLIGFTIIGCVLGFIQAIKKGTLTDNAIGIFTLIFGSIPAIFLIFPLILILGYQWDLLPTQYPDDSDPMKLQLIGLIIPFLALAGYPLATIARITRGEIVDSLDSEYILLARTKGLSRKQAVYRHSLRNSLVSIMPHIPSLFLATMMASILMESVYGIPGVATWYLDSMYRPMMDTGYYSIVVPNAVIITMFYVTLGLVMTLIVDLLYGLVDPRIKIYSHKK